MFGKKSKIIEQQGKLLYRQGLRLTEQGNLLAKFRTDNYNLKKKNEDLSKHLDEYFQELQKAKKELRDKKSLIDYHYAHDKADFEHKLKYVTAAFLALGVDKVSFGVDLEEKAKEYDLICTDDLHYTLTVSCKRREEE